MPLISPIGKPQYRQHGFTLLEVLLGLFIVGLMAGLVSFSLPDHHSKQLQKSVEHLQRTLLQLREQAVFESRDYGLWLTPNGYRIYVYRGRQWEQVKTGASLTETTFDESVKISLAIEGQIVATARAEFPQILILSDGQITPFTLTLQDPSYSRRLQLSAQFLSPITVSEVGPSEASASIAPEQPS